MVQTDFSHVEYWVFDLDNTLYPPSARLFDQIERRMTAYVMASLGVDQAQADHLRRKYWAEHGTTLAGLMREHDVDPTPYLTDVHEIDLSVLEPDAALADAINALPGRKIIYTNGSSPYAERVAAARGLEGCFDAVYGVEHAGFHPKPDQAAFDMVFATDGIVPDRAAMFEDDLRNLLAPHKLGMRTVHVAPTPEPADHVHHHTDDLRHFLGLLA
ncbi:MAG: pyrimidine 5'-nucleotidase [Brevirhabdus sp.]